MVTLEHIATHTPQCVRNGKHHDSNECTKDHNTPAKCALCCGDHPASYKSCPSHKELQKAKSNKPIVENYWTKKKYPSQNTQQSTQANSNPPKTQKTAVLRIPTFKTNHTMNQTSILIFHHSSHYSHRSSTNS